MTNCGMRSSSEVCHTNRVGLFLERGKNEFEVST